MSEEVDNIVNELDPDKIKCNDCGEYKNEDAFNPKFIDTDGSLYYSHTCDDCRYVNERR